MGITEFLATYITAFISQTWYITVFLGMIMESMIFPVPSEAIMPFAGFLVATNEFNFRIVIFTATLWTVIGSLLSYMIGYYWGKPFIRKFGKYFLLDQEELEWTEHFFAKKWWITIFVSRFIPVIRHLISLPAGMGKMKLLPFILYTVIGWWLWNTFLVLVGKYLKQNWSLVMQYSKIVDVVVLGLLVLILFLFVLRQIKKYRKNKK